MMAERTCAHISALTTVKHAKRLPCDECVKIQALRVHQSGSKETRIRSFGTGSAHWPNSTYSLP